MAEGVAPDRLAPPAAPRVVPFTDERGLRDYRARATQAPLGPGWWILLAILILLMVFEALR